MLSEEKRTIQVMFETIELLERYVENIEDTAFSLGAMKKAPCFVCGYNGHSYYQPDVHPCAERHHRLYNAAQKK